MSKSMLEKDSLGNLPSQSSDNKITVNLSVPSNLNDAGLHTLKGTPLKTKPLNHEEIEGHLKIAVQALTEIWKRIKEEKSEV